jgi:hypothetical protein
LIIAQVEGWKMSGISAMKGQETGEGQKGYDVLVDFLMTADIY